MTKPSANRPHFILTGGGTGGHLFPGLAVAERLAAMQPSAEITIAGTGPLGFSELIEQAGHRYLQLSCRPFTTRPLGLLRSAAANARAYWASLRFLARNRTAAVIGLGGYASAPMARAAAARGIPLILLEQNAVPGKATGYLARWAKAVCLALPEASAALPAECPVHVTGNPVRMEFGVPTVVPGTPPQLLIIGGSGGAQALNRTVPAVLSRLRPSLAAWRIVHQTGRHDFEATRHGYAAAGLQATVLPWLDNMADQMRRSHLAISRAGGTTLAELAASGLPAVLVPYPHAAGDHQRANARAYWSVGAAEVV
ncbi:MAG: UDP-N-acetylglucosamine--N-acetylmuramyl-(pentapeptide) pyrophosphoryl-undecaprenol N-acetylglucosamine transferase, partial [Patescibacteria group bacterium]|nr:UDP-N-acetylglucosamine--N-acetylmuramyl-(pentapeptide) pyrophosphoryl-undecaprenol N-acetylglucosamine transferase [Patescibacteria group bacterium]